MLWFPYILLFAVCIVRGFFNYVVRSFASRQCQTVENVDRTYSTQSLTFIGNKERSKSRKGKNIRQNDETQNRSDQNVKKLQRFMKIFLFYGKY